jgi:hypothetical protein
MVSTTTQLGVESAINTMNLLLKIIDEKTKEAYRLYWDVLLSSLSKYWIDVVSILTIILLIALIEAAMGRWGMLGSVLYNYLYFGILFVVGLIWGPDVFVSNFFHVACTLILYPTCYLIVGIFLERTGFRKRYR